jgi:predicted DNA-binding protein (UPF0278 family)
MVGTPGLISISTVVVYKFKCVDRVVIPVADSDNHPVVVVKLQVQKTCDAVSVTEADKSGDVVGDIVKALRCNYRSLQSPSFDDDEPSEVC